MWSSFCVLHSPEFKLCSIHSPNLSLNVMSVSLTISITQLTHLYTNHWWPLNSGGQMPLPSHSSCLHWWSTESIKDADITDQFTLEFIRYKVISNKKLLRIWGQVQRPETNLQKNNWHKGMPNEKRTQLPDCHLTWHNADKTNHQNTSMKKRKHMGHKLRRTEIHP